MYKTETVGLNENFILLSYANETSRSDVIFLSQNKKYLQF